MAARALILRDFYDGVETAAAKVETKRHGFAYLRELGRRAAVDYCEYKNGVYKYRLSGMAPGFFARLLEEHVEGALNLCAYFGAEKSRVLVMNLDSVSRWQGKEKIPALYLARGFGEAGIPPLVLRSGHGYHFLCRVAEPVENGRLREFAQALLRGVIAGMEARGVDTGDLQCTCHPRPRSGDVSIRLFGSPHMRTGLFPGVVTAIGRQDAVLGEDESWAYFEEYARDCTLAPEAFGRAWEKLCGGGGR